MGVVDSFLMIPMQQFRVHVHRAEQEAIIAMAMTPGMKNSINQCFWSDQSSHRYYGGFRTSTPEAPCSVFHLRLPK
jgi:hypothetical protein